MDMFHLITIQIGKLSNIPHSTFPPAYIPRPSPSLLLTSVFFLIFARVYFYFACNHSFNILLDINTKQVENNNNVKEKRNNESKGTKCCCSSGV